MPALLQVRLHQGRKGDIGLIKQTIQGFGFFPGVHLSGQRPQGILCQMASRFDGSSASTSEILAGGMKDLGRARIFGTHTAAAALPSVFEMLPNGDGFQYAVANYLSEGGKPLEGLGVTPDVETPLTRQALLAGKDPALDAAIAWIKKP